MAQPRVCLGSTIVLLGRLSSALGSPETMTGFLTPFDHARWLLENAPPGVGFADQQHRLINQAMIDMTATIVEVLRAPP